MGMNYYNLCAIFKANSGKAYGFAQKHLPITAGRVASKMGEASSNIRLDTKLQQKTKTAKTPSLRSKYGQRRTKHYRRTMMR